MHPLTPPADPRASRRQFVGGTVLAGGAAAAAAAEPDRAEGVERAARPVEIETDVLVCGGGCAGTAAAMASAAGTDVGRLDGREVRGTLAKRGACPFTTA